MRAATGTHFFLVPSVLSPSENDKHVRDRPHVRRIVVVHDGGVVIFQ